jgi:hypothetical protein
MISPASSCSRAHAHGAGGSLRAACAAVRPRPRRAARFDGDTPVITVAPAASAALRSRGVARSGASHPPRCAPRIHAAASQAAASSAVQRCAARKMQKLSHGLQPERAGLACAVGHALQPPHPARAPLLYPPLQADGRAARA